jgi:hypothetical protein
MKLLVLIALIIVTHSYAQDGDHADNSYSSKCTDSSKTCLVINEDEIQLIDIEDVNRVIVGKRLNNRFGLSGVVEADKICIKNNSNGLCDIVGLMAGVDQADYHDGGHIFIDGLKCNSTTGQLSFTEVIEWTPMSYSLRNFSIKKCHDLI